MNYTSNKNLLLKTAAIAILQIFLLQNTIALSSPAPYSTSNLRQQAAAQRTSTKTSNAVDKIFGDFTDIDINVSHIDIATLQSFVQNVFGLSRLDKESVKKRYRELANLLHPDKNGNSADPNIAEAFKMLNFAKQIADKLLVKQSIDYLSTYQNLQRFIKEAKKRGSSVFPELKIREIIVLDKGQRVAEFSYSGLTRIEVIEENTSEAIFVISEDSHGNNVLKVTLMDLNSQTIEVKEQLPLLKENIYDIPVKGRETFFIEKKGKDLQIILPTDSNLTMKIERLEEDTVFTLKFLGDQTLAEEDFRKAADYYSRLLKKKPDEPLRKTIKLRYAETLEELMKQKPGNLDLRLKVAEECLSMYGEYGIKDYWKKTNNHVSLGKAAIEAILMIDKNAATDKIEERFSLVKEKLLLIITKRIFEKKDRFVSRFGFGKKRTGTTEQKLKENLSYAERFEKYINEKRARDFLILYLEMSIDQREQIIFPIDKKSVTRRKKWGKIAKDIKKRFGINPKIYSSFLAEIDLILLSTAVGRNFKDHKNMIEEILRSLKDYDINLAAGQEGIKVSHTEANDYIQANLPWKLLLDPKNIKDYKQAEGYGITARGIPIAGLFKNTGQFGHIGLGQVYGEPVIYVDADLTEEERQDVLNHELFEISKWEALRAQLNKKPAEMRKWIKENYKDAEILDKSYHLQAPSIDRLFSKYSSQIYQGCENHSLTIYIGDDRGINISATPSPQARPIRLEVPSKFLMQSI